MIVTDKSSSELSVEWKPPLLPYGILTHYSLYVNFTNGSDLRREDTRDGDTTSHTLTHLQPFQLVVVQVSASTSVAEGPRSIASENRTLEAGECAWTPCHMQQCPTTLGTQLHGELVASPLQWRAVLQST